MHISPASAWRHPCLVADIGGTNARFVMISQPGARPSAMVRLETGAQDDILDTVHRAIAAGHFAQPRSVLIAAAGPVSGKAVVMTNGKNASGQVRIDGACLASALNLEQGLLLNDFEALCLSLPFLNAQDVQSLGGGTGSGQAPRSPAPRLVVGPGTGLGVAALVEPEGRYLGLASEGGHISFGPGSADEHKLWPYLELPEVFAEDLLSGRGLKRLYDALARQAGEVPSLKDQAGITAAAATGTDQLAKTSVALFVSLLGRFAADMALTFGATGGVFIAGGIVPRLFAQDRQAVLNGFRQSFGAKGPFADIARQIPVNLIVAEDAAMRGLAAIAATPERFSSALQTRFWR